MATLGESIRYNAFALQDHLRGGIFDRHYKEIAHLLSDAQALRRFQSRAFHELATTASTSRHYEEIPIDTPLSDYPVLAKGDLKASPDSFRAKLPEATELVTVSTSGSYGVPLQVDITRTKKVRQRAEVAYFGSWAGYRVGTRHMYLRGRAGRSRVARAVQNQHFAATDVLTDEWLDRQIHTLQTERVPVVIGVPTPIALIARRAEFRQISPDTFSVRGVITSGESLTEETRGAITRAFGTPLCLSRYSTEELGVIASECPERNVHHLNEASYVVELLRLDSDKAAQPGELGRVVVTDLFSHATPLIRYDTGDLAVEGATCGCGRPTRTLKRVEGRIVEMLTAPDGQLLTPFFINPIMRRATDVRQFQFAQIGRAHYELRVVGGSSEQLAGVVADIVALLGQAASVRVKPTTSIPPLPSGKRPYVVNEWAAR